MLNAEVQRLCRGGEYRGGERWCRGGGAEVVVQRCRGEMQVQRWWCRSAEVHRYRCSGAGAEVMVHIMAVLRAL